MAGLLSALSTLGLLLLCTGPVLSVLTTMASVRNNTLPPAPISPAQSEGLLITADPQKIVPSLTDLLRLTCEIDLNQTVGYSLISMVLLRWNPYKNDFEELVVFDEYPPSRVLVHNDLGASEVAGIWPQRLWMEWDFPGANVAGWFYCEANLYNAQGGHTKRNVVGVEVLTGRVDLDLLADMIRDLKVQVRDLQAKQDNCSCGGHSSLVQAQFVDTNLTLGGDRVFQSTTEFDSFFEARIACLQEGKKLLENSFSQLNNQWIQNGGTNLGPAYVEYGRHESCYTFDLFVGRLHLTSCSQPGTKVLCTGK